MIQLNINDQLYELDVEKDMPLLWAIRDVLGFTGTKYGCGIAQCGACTVHMDGVPTRSCVTPVGVTQNKKITTIEGLNSKTSRAVQAAWERLDVVQCGYCQSGQIMAATALLEAQPDPSDEQINAAMSGNICRCATYVRIRAGIREASRALV